MVIADRTFTSLSLSLALKYHPDRNPGKEVEFLSKFQSIQSAHEILSDPQQRLKYDTERLRRGYARAYTSTSTASSSTKPPPSANSARKTPATGGGGGGSTKTNSARSNFNDSRANGTSTTGTQPNNHNQRAYNSRWSSFEPKTGTGDASKARTYTPPKPKPRTYTSSGQSTRPKSAYEAFNSTSSSHNRSTAPSPEPKKKQGFAPGSAGGDEPMARNTSAYKSGYRAEWSNYFHDTTTTSTDEETTKGPERRPGPTPTETPRPTPNLHRSKSQYAHVGGEKIDLSYPSLGRSATTREAPHKDSLNGGSKRESAIPGYYDQYQSTSSSSDSVNSGADRKKAVPKSRLRPNQKASEFQIPRKQTPGSGNGKFPILLRLACLLACLQWLTQDFEIKGQQQSTSSAAKPDTKASSIYNDPFYFTRDIPQPHPPTASATNAAKPDTKASSIYNDPFYFTRQTPEAYAYKLFAESNRDEPPVKENLTNINGQMNDDMSNKDKDTSGEDVLNDQFEKFSFGSGGQQQSHGPRFSFAPKWWQPNFSEGPHASAFPSTSKFSADKWMDYFKNLSWVSPPVNSSGSGSGGSGNGSGGGGSPRKQANASASRNPRKQSKTTVTGNGRTVPQSASVSTEAEEEQSTFVNGGSNEGSKGEDAEAMDVDDETPAVSTNTVNTATTGGRGSVPRRKAVPRSAANINARQDTQDTLNLKELNNVTPFTTTNNGGINDLQDIGATLPFQSQPKGQGETRGGRGGATWSAYSTRPRNLQCPNPPKRPRIPVPIPALSSTTPNVIGTETKQPTTLSRQAWTRYLQEMEVYMREWKAFDRRMLYHFTARQEAVETGLSSNWISAVGDSIRLNDSSTVNGDDDDDEMLISGTGKGGYKAYLRAIEEDETVRKHWEVACELHKECILQLGIMRNYIKNGNGVKLV